MNFLNLNYVLNLSKRHSEILILSSLCKPMNFFVALFKRVQDVVTQLMKSLLIMPLYKTQYKKTFYRITCTLNSPETLISKTKLNSRKMTHLTILMSPTISKNYYRKRWSLIKLKCCDHTGIVLGFCYWDFAGMDFVILGCCWAYDRHTGQCWDYTWQIFNRWSYYWETTGHNTGFAGHMRKHFKSMLRLCWADMTIQS